MPLTVDNTVGKPPRHRTTRQAFTLRSSVILALGLALIPALGIIVLTGLEYGRNLVMDVQADTMRQVESFAGMQEHITESTRRLLTTLTALPGFRSLDRAPMTEILKAVHNDNSEYLNFTVLDENGICIASSRLSVGVDLSDRPHFIAAKRDDSFAPGQYIIARVDDEPSFAYAQPIRNNEGRFIGELTAVYKLSSYSELFDRLQLPDDSILGLVDRQGKRLYYHPPKSTNPLGSSIKESVWKAMINNGDSGIFLESGSDGIKRYYGYRTLRITGAREPYMYVVSATSTDRVSRINCQILLRSLIFMFIAAGFAFAIVGVLSKRIIGRRLTLILDATERIAHGNFGQKVGFGEEESEMGRVAKALDIMAEAVSEREQARDKASKNFEIALVEKNILLKEVHHRVKNNLQIILSLFSLEHDSGRKPEEYIGSMERRIESMSTVHEMLYQAEDLSLIDLGDYATRLIYLISSSMNDDHRIIRTVDIESVALCIDVAIPFGLLLNELLTNAYKHAFPDDRSGTISVNLRIVDGMAMLEVKDDGPGLPDGFSIGAASGLGLRLALALSEQLAGTLSWESDNGACFRVRFPIIGRCVHRTEDGDNKTVD